MENNQVYTEDLDVFRQFSVGIDAEVLLRKVNSSNVLQSIQDGHRSLDLGVQQEIEEMLKTFRQKYQISVVVVLEGMRPAFLTNDGGAVSQEVKTLQMSQ